MSILLRELVVDAGSVIVRAAHLRQLRLRVRLELVVVRDLLAPFGLGALGSSLEMLSPTATDPLIVLRCSKTGKMKLEGVRLDALHVLDRVAPVGVPVGPLLHRVERVPRRE